MGDRNLDTAFECVWGRALSSEEQRRLLRLRESLGISNNDALWAVLFALQYHLELYEAMPDKISTATKEVLDASRATANANIRAAEAEMKRGLIQGVLDAVRDIAGKVYLRELLERTGIVTVVITLIFSAGAWHMHDLGQQSGYAAGWGNAYQQAQNEKAAASWANTPEGKRAYRLAELGSLNMLYECSGTGWQTEKGLCYPFPTKKGTFGWRISAAK